jgi:DNA-binding transcriptional MerR regulator
MYNIDNLARLAGITRRTVRYYIQRGLLPPPKGQKRGAYYTDEHLDKLKMIQKLSARGVPLIQIQNILGSDESVQNIRLDDEMVAKTRWDRFEIHNGVELVTRPNIFTGRELKNIRDYIRKLIEEKNGNGEIADGVVLRGRSEAGCTQED